jgi:hypothetical protein
MLLLDGDFGVLVDPSNLVDTSDDEAPRAAGISNDGMVPLQEGPFPPSTHPTLPRGDISTRRGSTAIGVHGDSAWDRHEGVWIGDVRR